MQDRIHDFIGIGIGPFNLGLAALSQPLFGVSALFLDQADGFDWHPGMLLDDATMQTPFMADLVTLADPTSRYSFLNYAKQQGKLYRFCIREDFFLLRREYNQYCQWVAGQLDNLRFQRFVQHAHYDSIEQCYVLLCLCTRTGRTERHRARRLVIGTGTQPWMPPCCEAVRHQVVHSSAYLSEKKALQGRRHIVVVGSGQSAAEIYLDLLRDRPRLAYRLDWITRAPRFFPLEYTKLTLEMTSPDYVDHFHALPPARRDTLLQSQQVLYKGINRSLINAIYDELYRQDLQGHGTQGLMTHTALTSCRHDAASKRFTLGLQHTELGRTQHLSCDAVVMATGHAWRQPPFMEGIEGRLRRDARGRLDVARNYSIDLLGREVFVQNAELHTHGFTAPDLSMAAYRNSVILQAMLGKAPYAIEERIAFQQFGMPSLETEADKEQAWG